MTRTETKAQISQRMSFEQIYGEISRLKIRETELDGQLLNLNNDLSDVQREIRRWNDIAALKRKALVAPTT